MVWQKFAGMDLMKKRLMVIHLWLDDKHLDEKTCMD